MTTARAGSLRPQSRWRACGRGSPPPPHSRHPAPRGQYAGDGPRNTNLPLRETEAGVADWRTERSCPKSTQTAPRPPPGRQCTHQRPPTTGPEPTIRIGQKIGGFVEIESCLQPLCKSQQSIERHIVESVQLENDEVLQQFIRFHRRRRGHVTLRLVRFADQVTTE